VIFLYRRKGAGAASFAMPIPWRWHRACSRRFSDPIIGVGSVS